MLIDILVGYYTVAGLVLITANSYKTKPTLTRERQQLETVSAEMTVPEGVSIAQ